jgi:Berberine and berberine like
LRGPSTGHFKQILISSPYQYSKSNSGEDVSYTPAWRDAIWNVITGYFWNYDTDVPTVKKLYQATSAAIQPLRDLTPDSGAYHAEADVHEPDHEGEVSSSTTSIPGSRICLLAAFWGSNYARLLQIKKKYDPHGLLDCWHCVGWKGAGDGRYSCHV